MYFECLLITFAFSYYPTFLAAALECALEWSVFQSAVPKLVQSGPIKGGRELIMGKISCFQMVCLPRHLP
jgi:ABC-type arginine/histidine transport system permease subunit